MGRQSYIAFIVVVAQTILGGGLATALLRFTGDLVGRGRERSLSSLTRCTMPIGIVLGGLGGLALVVAAALGASPAWAWIYAGIATTAGVLSVVPGNILLGTQHWRAFAYSVLITGALSVAATLVVLELGGGITGMLAVLAATAVARYLWVEILARRLLAEFGHVREPVAELRSQVLTFSLAMSVPVVLNLVVSQRSELFILEHSSTDSQIALYSIAFSATAALIAVPRAIGAVLTPSVAALVGSGESERIQSGFSRVLRLGLLFGLPITFAGLALGPDLLRLLYGPRYAGAGDVLLIAMATVPVTPVAGASGALLVGYGRVRAPVVVSAVAAVVDIGLAIVLIPHIDALGAAIANSCASLVATGLLLAAAVRLVGGIHLGWGSILRVTAVSAVAAALGRLVLLAGEGAGMFLLATLVLLAALAAGALIVRVVSQDDAFFLIRVVGRRGRLARVLDRLTERPVRAPA
jgi:O-antigen/teichoic acid export membrane protein